MIKLRYVDFNPGISNRTKNDVRHISINFNSTQKCNKFTSDLKELQSYTIGAGDQFLVEVRRG